MKLFCKFVVVLLIVIVSSESGFAESIRSVKEPCDQWKKRALGGLFLVRTQYNTKWKMNVPYKQKQENSIVFIQYSCDKKILKSHSSDILYKYGVISNKGKVEDCTVKNNECSCKKQNFGLSRFETTIRISEHQKDLKLLIKKCDKMIMTPITSGNKSVDHRQIFDKIIITDMSKKKIQITLSTYPSMKELAILVFNIEKVKSGRDFCSFKCVNCSCVPVPFYDLMGKCGQSGSFRISRQVHFPNMCLKNPWLCQDSCYQTPNCEYLCGKMVNNIVVETKYVVKLQRWTINGVGSKSWKWNEIPLNMTVFNECNYSQNLCFDPLTKIPMPKSCVDTDDGFKCSQNSKINHTLCSELKTKTMSKNVPYWKCPQKVLSKIPI